MQGLLAQEAPQQPATQQIAPQTEQAAASGAAALQEHIKKIVLAAQHVMYSPQTRSGFISEVKRGLQNGKPAQVSAAIAVDLILTLVGESKFKMNPRAIVPAGVMITGDILGFIEKAAGVHITQQDSHKAMELFTRGILKKIGTEQ